MFELYNPQIIPYLVEVGLKLRLSLQHCNLLKSYIPILLLWPTSGWRLEIAEKSKFQVQYKIIPCS